MKARKQKYSLRLIKENYTYTLQEIADLFGVDLMTVRRWVRDDGLRRIPGVRPYLVHSSELRRFRAARNNARKRKCEPGKVYCFRCRLPKIPNNGTGIVVFQPNNCVRFQALCSTCGGRMNKAIKAKEWSENHPLLHYMHDAAKQPNGAHSQHLECHFQKEEQLCLNLTL